MRRTRLAIAGISLATLAGCGIGPVSFSADRPAKAEPVVKAIDPNAPRPNILLITVDDAAAGDLRYMPHVRRLIGDQGVTVTNGIAPTPICAPARASLLTGQYTHNHGVLGVNGSRGGFRALKDKQTLPVWLQAAGYDTYFVGKYLNNYGRSPAEKRYVPPGWSDWHGSLDPATYNYSKTVTNRNGRVVVDKTYSTDSFAAQTDSMLRKAGRKSSPFYLWVNYVAPHHGGPSDADDPTRWKPKSKSALRTASPAARHRNLFRRLQLPKGPSLFRKPTDSFVGATRHSWTKRERREVREAYQQRLEALQAVDEAVAGHVRVLRRSGDLKDTLIVFTSDNGYFLGQHNLHGKLWFFNEGVTVPMVIRGPGLPKGDVTNTAVSHVDLPVTFAAAAGVQPTASTDGADVMPWLKRKQRVVRVVPIEAYPVSASGSRQLYAGVRIGDEWTYAVNSHGAEELYDLIRDPYQVRNVARDPAAAAVLSQARVLTDQYRNCMGQDCPREAYLP
ncbi:sulfatase [Nocardioides sp. Bht2]|uniref:sulfatase family protein n=1 Tax=Nocardioides sp. Bht2 TaxID=3392297 RepID=UPI0039B59D0E